MLICDPLSTFARIFPFSVYMSTCIALFFPTLMKATSAVLGVDGAFRLLGPTSFPLELPRGIPCPPALVGFVALSHPLLR